MFTNCRTRWLTAALAAAGILAGTSLLAAPTASAVTRPAGLAADAIGFHAKTAGQKAALAYWTPARLRAAKPADIINAGARPPARPATTRPAGPADSVPGGLPAGRGPAAVLRQGAVALPRSVTGPAAFSYPYPYDSFAVPTTLFPWSVNGRLFFTNNGGNWSCSATSVASSAGPKDENEIWTAGHCLVNTTGNNQVVDRSAVFIPAFNGNNLGKPEQYWAPFGEFFWTGSWETTSAWYYHSDLTEDEAAMIVGNSSLTGRTLGNSVGWDGFAWNWPVNQQFVAFGYPAAPPYNGNSLILDLAATAGQDSRGGANPVEPIVIGNPMTGGSSGGAWDIGWSLSGPGWINGHNDYKYTSQPLGMYSPYQDSLSNIVRCFGASSC